MHRPASGFGHFGGTLSAVASALVLRCSRTPETSGRGGVAGWRFFLWGLLIAALLAGAVTADAAAATPATPRQCKEVERTQPAPDDAKNLVELQPNAARPTFAVKLDYNTSANDDISFAPRGGRRVGASADVAAEFTDAPRYKGDRLRGDAFIAAHASESGRRIIVDACFENVPQYAAGRYEGTVALFGPQLADFTYAIVITAKWPRWIAWLTIFATVMTALVIGITTNTFKRPVKWGDGKGWLRVIVGVVLAVTLGGFAYWSVYASNETWGSTPPSDLTALVTAAFTAAVGGLATAAKLVSP